MNMHVSSPAMTSFHLVIAYQLVLLTMSAGLLGFKTMSLPASVLNRVSSWLSCKSPFPTKVCQCMNPLKMRKTNIDVEKDLPMVAQSRKPWGRLRSLSNRQNNYIDTCYLLVNKSINYKPEKDSQTYGAYFVLFLKSGRMKKLRWLII